MIDAATRAQACRVFEDTLRQCNYAVDEPVTLACTLPDTDGTRVIVAQYRVYPDGTFAQVNAEEPTP